MQVTTDVDAAGTGEQRRQQQDEGDVFLDRRVHEAVQGRTGAVDDRKGQHEGQHPDGDHLAIMVMPEDRCQQRQNGDRQQCAGKGHAPPDRQRGAIDQPGRPDIERQPGQHQQQQRKRRGRQEARPARTILAADPVAEPARHIGMTARHIRAQPDAPTAARLPVDTTRVGSLRRGMHVDGHDTGGHR